MAQVGNNVNRNSGSHLIADEDHMGEILQRVNSQQGNGEGEQLTAQQQQGSSDRTTGRQNDNRTRQSY